MTPLQHRTAGEGGIPIYLAHDENDKGEVDRLEDHLQRVAKWAAEFGRPLRIASSAYAAGLLHDLGKFRDEFQQYLRGERKGGAETHHAVYGAKYAFDRSWVAAAFSIAGHHAGLHDSKDIQALVEGPKYALEVVMPTLQRRFEERVGAFPPDPGMPDFVEEDVLRAEFFVRMVFSCLVDADFLATEAHYSGGPRQIVRLRDVYEVLLKRLLAERARKDRTGFVNEIRHRLFEQCLAKAPGPQGFFSLTAPTGSGKTLSGMAFALAHAKRRQLDRVIVVIPYLSIIEQNAAEYRRVLDPDEAGIIVEHHSAVEPTKGAEEDAPDPASLAAENWDAPIIVTTSVQFIESLFASSPSKCRKLHNIANSIVVFDEVQTFPTHLLNPLLSVLRELKQNYGASFLFMTATQPAFRRSPALTEGFEAGEITEIAEDAPQMFSALCRVTYEDAGEVDWEEAAERMAAQPQVLCVVNVRKHAFALWEKLRSLLPEAERDALFHLSSAMCAEHRLDLLGEIEAPQEGTIRWRLKHGLPCRLVATQLIEAGVDVDFPVLFRAMGPLDSIVQAAGRCNREGKLRDANGGPMLGKVILFTPQEHALPPGVYTTAANHTGTFLQRVGLERLATEPQIFEEYFSSLFPLTATDYAAKRETTIQEDREKLRFRQVSRKAKVIRDDGVPVVVPYGAGEELIEEIRSRQPTRERPRFDRLDLRRLQRFMVTVRPRDFDYMEHVGLVSPLLPNLNVFVLEAGCYHEHLGLLLQQRPLEELCGV